MGGRWREQKCYWRKVVPTIQFIANRYKSVMGIFLIFEFLMNLNMNTEGTNGISSTRETYMRRSFVFSNVMPSTQQRSYISTSIVNDSYAFGDDLRKSRIQNLPNYRKINLGDNLQFIVVFQTIEIERLSNEVEVLRVRVKENQRQLFNYQNYEVQIRQLTEKCFALEREREEYRDEIDKLSKICETLYHENETLKVRLQENDYSLKQKYESEKQKNAELTMESEKWKNRYSALDKSKAKQLEQLRNMMESQRKSMIDREIRQVTIRFQNERSSLENQIRKCREILESRNREIDDLRQKCQKYQISHMELKNYENMIGEFENKITLINQQLIRLNQVLQEKQQEIQSYKQRQFKLSQQLKEQQQWEHENKQLRTTVQNRIKQIEQWKVRCSRLEEESNRAKEMTHYNEELTSKLVVSGREIQRLNNVLRNKLDEIEQWKKRLMDRENQLSKLKNVEDELANHATRFGMLQAENDRINNMLKSKQAEIEEWRGRHNKVEGKLANMGFVEQEKANLQSRLNDQVKAGEQMQFLITKMEKQVTSYRVFEDRVRQMERDNGNLVKQIERLNGIIRSNINQLKDYQTKYNRLESTISEYRNIEMKMKDLENKISMLSQENSRLNTLIRSKNDDIEALEKEKVQMHTTINHYKNYEIKISESESIVKNLNEQVLQLRGDNQNWQKKVREFENKSRQLENYLFANNQEKQKLSNMIKAKSNQYDQLRGKYSELQMGTRKAQQLELVCQEQHNQILTYISEIERFQTKLKEYETQIDKEREMVSELACRVIVLSCEVERLVGGGGTTGGMKTRQYEQLKESYSRLQSKVTSKNNQIDILLSKISGLQSKVSQLGQEYARLLAQVERSENQSRQMSSRIDEYQDYARRIHILGAEIDRLQLQNKSYDEDARRIRLKFADGLSHEKKQEDFNFLTVIMGIQIESLRARVDQREVTIDEMRRSILEPVRKI